LNGNAEAVLENAYDVIITGEINGIDTLGVQPALPGREAQVSGEREAGQGRR
jgi:hypothetical protein